MTNKEKISFGALGGPSLLEEDPELFWDRILNDTWSHNEYFDIMCNLFWKKYPIERHESTVWADPVTKSEDEMREIIRKLEDYWKSHIRELLKDDEKLDYKRLREQQQKILRIAEINMALEWGDTDASQQWGLIIDIIKGWNTDCYE